MTRPFRFSPAAVAVMVTLMTSGSGTASAAPPKFTSAVELKLPSGAPAGSNDVDISTDPVSAGYGAASAYSSGAYRWGADGMPTPLTMPDPAKGQPFGDDWNDWLHAQVLCREAEALLKKESDTKKLGAEKKPD